LGQTVIVVDDGVATGGTMLAAIQAVKKQLPKFIVVAVPVCAKDTAEEIREKVDQFICLDEVESMEAIGMFYQDFHQITDEEVVALLHKNHDEIHSKKDLKSPSGLVAM
jgi:predicted phosphoribosyltransferase